MGKKSEINRQTFVIDLSDIYLAVQKKYQTHVLKLLIDSNQESGSPLKSEFLVKYSLNRKKKRWSNEIFAIFRLVANSDFTRKGIEGPKKLLRQNKEAIVKVDP